MGQKFKQETKVAPSKNKYNTKSIERKQQAGNPAPNLCSTPIKKDCREIFKNKEDQDNCIDKTLEVSNKSENQNPPVWNFPSTGFDIPKENSQPHLIHPLR